MYHVRPSEQGRPRIARCGSTTILMWKEIVGLFQEADPLPVVVV
jgi:hypothetical protein